MKDIELLMRSSSHLRCQMRLLSKGSIIVADYLKLTEKENTLQDDLQVEEHRANCPNMQRGKKRVREDEVAEAVTALKVVLLILLAK